MSPVANDSGAVSDVAVVSLKLIAANFPNHFVDTPVVHMTIVA